MGGRGGAAPALGRGDAHREPVRAGPARGHAGVDNPLGIPALGGLPQALIDLGGIGALVCIPAGIVAAVLRYRRGTTVERKQLKWFGSVLVLAFSMFFAATLLPQPYGQWAWIVASASIGLVPVAIGIAILRYRLYEIDRIVSRTIGWALVTALLAAVFAGTIIGLQALLAAASRTTTPSRSAASTLVVAALFQPLRRARPAGGRPAVQPGPRGRPAGDRRVRRAPARRRGPGRAPRSAPRRRRGDGAARRCRAVDPAARGSGPMKGRSRRAWGAIALGFLIALPAAAVGQEWSGWMITMAFGGVGIALLWQRPREVVGRILVGIAVAFSVVGALVPGSASQVVDGHADITITLYAWFSAWGVGLFFGLFITLAAVFPSGHFPAGRVGLAGRVAVVTPFVFGTVLALGPSWRLTFADGSAALVNLPIGIASTWPVWTVLQDLVFVAVVGALATSIATLIVRFRRSAGPERAQYKWLLAALAATLATVIFAFAVILLGDSYGDGTWMWTPAVIAYPMIPLSILVAITRYRLYEIDRIVSRTIGWALVTGLLLAVFAGTIVGLQAVLAPFTNNNTLAVAGSTLVAAALFQPLRARVQRAVDRRFNRARVDAQHAIDAFGVHLRDEVDLTALRGRLVHVATEAVQPTGAGLWVRRMGS